MKTTSLVACHECDLLHKIQPLPEGGLAKCSRCGAILYRHKHNSLDRTLALTITGLILFVLVNVYPILSFKLGGDVQPATLITGVRALYDQDMWGLALLVLLTSIIMPLVGLLGMLYVLLPLKFNCMPWKLPLVFRIVRSLQPWGMLEVFMLGILVSITKLAGMATVIPGLALYSLALLIFVLAAVAAYFDPGIVWERLGESQ